MSTSKVTTVGPISIWIEWNETITDDYFTYHPQIYASTTRNVGDPSAPTKFTLYENGQTVTSIGSWQYPGGVYYPSGYGKGPYCIYTWDYSKTGISFPRQKVRIDQIQTIRLYQQFDNFFGGSGSSYKITIDETLLIPAKPGELQVQPDPPEITSDIGDSVSIGDKYYARWRYLPTMGDNQIKYEIQYGNSLTNDEIDEPETTGIIESSQNIHIFNTNHLTVGDTIYWQVRTYGFALDGVEDPPNDGWSNWSIIHATSIIAQPAPSHKFLSNLDSSGGLWPHIKQYIANFFTSTCKDHIVENQTVERLVEEYTEGSETVTHNVKWEYHIWDNGIIDAQGIFQTKITVNEAAHIVTVPLPITMASTSYLFFANVDNYYCSSVYAGWDTKDATTYVGSDTKNINQAQVAMYVTNLQGSVVTVRVWLHGKIANIGQNTVLTFTKPSQWSQNSSITESSAEGTIYTDVMNLSPSYSGGSSQRVIINLTGSRIVTTTPIPIGNGMKIQASCNNGYQLAIIQFKTSTRAIYKSGGYLQPNFWVQSTGELQLPADVDCIGIGLKRSNDAQLNAVNVADAGLVLTIYDGGEVNG